jgi:hypothetical protein
MECVLSMKREPDLIRSGSWISRILGFTGQAAKPSKSKSANSRSFICTCLIPNINCLHWMFLFVRPDLPFFGSCSVFFYFYPKKFYTIITNPNLSLQRCLRFSHMMKFVFIPTAVSSFLPQDDSLIIRSVNNKVYRLAIF